MKTIDNYTIEITEEEFCGDNDRFGLSFDSTLEKCREIYRELIKNPEYDPKQKIKIRVLGPRRAINKGTGISKLMSIYNKLRHSSRKKPKIVFQTDYWWARMDIFKIMGLDDRLSVEPLVKSQ